MREPFWIKITKNDIFPHPHERVLVVCYNPQNHYDIHVSIATNWGKIDGYPRWSGGKKVSHWASLPELPSDITDEDRRIARASILY